MTKSAGRVDEDLHAVIHHAVGHGRHDDMLHDLFADIRLRHLRRVLRADQHRVNALGLAMRILHRNLALAVRSQPGQRAIFAEFGQPPGEFMSQVDRHGHQLRGLVAGKAKHHPLIAGADSLDLGLRHFAGLDLQGLVHTQGNIPGLFANGHQARHMFSHPGPWRSRRSRFPAAPCESDHQN